MNDPNITVGILAHVDAGKTTLSEAILYLAGVVRSQGRVDHKDAFLDTYALEKSRGITIFSKQALFLLTAKNLHFSIRLDILIFLPKWNGLCRFLMLLSWSSAQQMV